MRNQLIMKKFVNEIVQYYAKHKRSDLPWRKQKYRTPYAITVSEIMLQQTQVSRVIRYFEKWMAEFPTVHELAQATPARVLTMWQGLGYNNRGLRLKRLAEVITTELGGEFPTSKNELQELPGIGPYTAGAIMAFAYNKPTVMIETNIRRVFIHHFFKGAQSVHDSELVPIIDKAMTYVTKNEILSAREWYWAMMDYGADLPKLANTNANTKSAHYTKQSRFQGSVRQVRSNIVKWLLEHPSIHVSRIAEMLGIVDENDARIPRAIASLVRDGMIVEQNGRVRLVK